MRFLFQLGYNEENVFPFELRGKRNFFIEFLSSRKRKITSLLLVLAVDSKQRRILLAAFNSLLCFICSISRSSEGSNGSDYRGNSIFVFSFRLEPFIGMEKVVTSNQAIG